MTAPQSFYLPPITEDVALELLRAEAEEKGYDYIYGDVCPYVVSDLNVATDEVENHRPGCMIGQALIRYGVPMAAFVTLPAKAGGTINSVGAPSLAEDLGRLMIVEITSDACDRFERAQDLQDAQWSWGTAYGAALCAALELDSNRDDFGEAA